MDTRDAIDAPPAISLGGSLNPKPKRVLSGSIEIAWSIPEADFIVLQK
jgi:hypothetical protein